MSWVVIGTVPYEDFPFVDAPCTLTNGNLSIGDQSVPITRGTPALLAAACTAARVLGVQPPQALLAGDIGLGDGSTLVYKYLVETLKNRSANGLMVFHYLLPEVDWHNRILIELDELSDRPLLVADAGYMYVAKMSGFASSYDLFTPDVGEMAFLADENAPHPFYTRGFLLQEEERASEMIERAYKHENAARYLLVKGRRDIVASAEDIFAEISEPCIENMEPIGGTGDTLTGIVAGLMASGRPIPEAAVLGAKINRLLGELTKPSPAFSVSDLLPSLPAAMETALSESSYIKTH